MYVTPPSNWKKRGRGEKKEKKISKNDKQATNIQKKLITTTTTTTYLYIYKYIYQKERERNMDNNSKTNKNKKGRRIV